MMILSAPENFVASYAAPENLNEAAMWFIYMGNHVLVAYDESGQRDQTDLLITLEYSYEAFPSFSAFTQEDVDENRFNQEFRLVSNSDGAFRVCLSVCLSVCLCVCVFSS